MIDCLEKQQQQLQNHQLQLMNMSQHQSSLNHQNPPSYSQANAVNSFHPVVLTAPVYPQQQQQQQTHLHQRPPQRPIVEGGVSHQQAGNELIGYYFGSISRETAEWILKTHGNNMNGAYLLRSSGPNDDFVLSLMVSQPTTTTTISSSSLITTAAGNMEVLHYKIVETEDSFVALHGQVGDEKFATIDELIDKAQGVATKPCWPIRRQTLESQILPPTYWGLTVDQVRLAILIKAKQWGFPLLSSLFQQQDQVQQLTNFNSGVKTLQQSQVPNNSNIDCNNQLPNEMSVTTLNNETIRTLIYKSLHEFQPWFHGKISREEAELRIEEGAPRDGKFLVRERDNYSYAMCISHKKTTKHYRIDVLPTGELAIQDGRKFTSLMALVSHYTIMSDGLWCALTEACPRPINGGRSACCDRTPLSKFAISNNGALASNSQIRMHQPNNNYYNSNSAQQNLYCVPPINNSNGNSNNNSIHNSILPGSINNISLENENNQTNLHNYNSNNTNQADATSKSQSSLMCVSHQGGVVSLKAPIREWLQTINHKWSQLIASKNQHQSLNSFLFGNQNPLNNHCKYNHRDHGHSMTHRHRKCKNGHASCACIRQQMLANRAIAAAPTNSITLKRSGQQFVKPNETDAAQTSFSSRPQHQMHNCCSSGATLCPSIKSQSSNGLMPNNFNNQNSSTFLENQGNNLNFTSNTLLSRLPLNSGFTLSSQSFIGSPLFAVKQAQLGKNKLLVGSGSQGSSSSNSGNSNNVEEERLISPVQSVAGNLNNNPYNFDIYGSQTSTALVNDQLPVASSSSSSETNRLMQRSLNNTNHPTNQAHYGSATAKVINQNDSMVVPSTKQQNLNHAGRILCGQHAGPAFRYTNWNDENNCKPCFHRPNVTCRAADDSHLTTSSTQLACPAAMSKFVQFQDGQCLRTHRDTRSIQMAYLSSRPTHNNLHQNHTQTRNNQVPFKELNSHQQNNIQVNSVRNNNTWNGVRNNNPNTLTNNNSLHNNASGSLKQNLSAQLVGQTDNKKNSCNLSMGNNNPESLCNEIDLMDCGDEENFNFKYDPKLIKSSSIETLCGFGNTEENLDDLINCKSNSELIMSLQSCWAASQQTQSNILRPMQSSGFNTTIDPNALFNSDDLSHDVAETNGESILSSLMIDSKQNEQLEHMKKKHDLDELTTNLLAELTASLKAQVDLKNKRSGFNNNNNNNNNSNLHNMEKADNQAQQDSYKQQQQQVQEQGHAGAEVNPLELINEFDTLIPNNNR